MVEETKIRGLKNELCNRMIPQKLTKLKIQRKRKINPRLPNN